jgi:predicted metal-binding membrane protein
MRPHSGRGILRFRSRHPEWWALALSALAGAVAISEMTVRLLPMPQHTDDLMGKSRMAANALVMTVAMMVPLVVRPLRTVAGRSLWRRRDQAVGFFLVAYLGRSGIAAIIATQLALGSGLYTLRNPAISAALCIFAAALWQITPVKRAALEECDRTIPLAPAGWAAVRDDLRYGWVIGESCLTNCWAVMAVAWLLPHSSAAMLGTGSILMLERYSARINQRALAGALSIVGLLLLATALRGSATGSSSSCMLNLRGGRGVQLCERFQYRNDLASKVDVSRLLPIEVSVRGLPCTSVQSDHLPFIVADRRS